MHVITAKSAGFCFGVKRAVEQVYETVKESGMPVYSYGSVIHNEIVMEDLKSQGLTVLHTKEELAEADDGVVMLRTHGVGKEIYDLLHFKGIPYQDLTCPYVEKIHELVSKYDEEGCHIIVIGNAAHPEVAGICGWCSPEHTTVVDSIEEAVNFTLSGRHKICIVAQTTYHYKKFKDLVEILEKKDYNSFVMNTICRATDRRQAETAKIAEKADAMLVIGSKESSNTRKLYEIAKGKCENTYYIQTMGDLDLSVFQSVNNVGITAGASTPNKIIEEVQNYVRSQF